MKYTVHEVQKLTGINKFNVRNYVKKKKIDGYKDPTNGFWYVTELGLKQLKEAKKLMVD